MGSGREGRKADSERRLGLVVCAGTKAATVPEAAQGPRKEEGAGEEDAGVWGEEAVVEHEQRRGHSHEFSRRRNVELRTCAGPSGEW